MRTQEYNSHNTHNQQKNGSHPHQNKETQENNTLRQKPKTTQESQKQMKNGTHTHQAKNKMQ